MDVIRVKTTRDYSLFGRVALKGTIFYVDCSTHRIDGSAIDWTNVYDSKGEHIGKVIGHWFDFANRTLFVKDDTPYDV